MNNAASNLRDGDTISILGVSCTIHRVTELGPQGGRYRAWTIRRIGGLAIAKACPCRASALDNAEKNLRYYGAEHFAS
jgi:hypothetical protein